MDYKLTSTAKWLLILCLLFLSASAPWYSVTMLIGLQFSFHSLFSVLAIGILGRRAALGISVVTLLVQWFVFHQTPLVFVQVLETAFLCMYTRSFKGSFLLRDFVFWVIVGSPYIYLLTFIDGKTSNAEIVLLLTVSILNGITNALLAELLLTYIYPFILQRKWGMKAKAIPFTSILFHLAVSGIVFPFFLFLVITGQYLDNMLHQRVQQLTSSLNNNLQENFNGWMAEDAQKLHLHADLQSGRLQKLVESNKSQLGAARMLILDNEEYVLADSRKQLIGDTWKWPQGDYYRYNGELMLWLPQGRFPHNMAKWHDALYIYENKAQNLDNLQVLITVPVIDELKDMQSVYGLNLTLVLSFILLVIAGVGIVSRVIISILQRLIQATSGLPLKISKGETLELAGGPILEFNWLVENVREMSVKLRLMFREAETMNTMLQEQTLKLTQSEQLFQHLAYNDNLTKLPNRLYFIQYMDSLESRKAISPVEVTLLFLDLDKFKLINDTYGHEVGDAVLVHAAHILTGSCGNAIVCRLAGDEFVIVLESTTRSQTESIARAILAGFQHPLWHAGYEIALHTSIGIAASPAHTEQLSELVKLADEAMYQAKQRGGSLFAWYSAGE
ncbi:GGDEF domain-containing protein [Paenibacillus sp. SI8]|uniref:GGDEF domain-containing protein n=1 Tax=unclassified Paenibacillus TaxID=185978 RepID=UPI00346554B1